MEVFTCAQEIDLAAYGIRHGKCIDDRYIRETFGLDVSSRKDPSQRRGCGCVVSKDIGMYDSCLFGCVYCYATAGLEKAQENRRRHDQEAPSLIPQRAVLQIVESECKAG
jgi:DNA repair photolyase